MSFQQLLKKYFLSIPSVVIRKTALDQENEWFDLSFNLIEELDLFIRIAYSWKLDMCRDVLAKYRVHKSSCSWTQTDLLYKEQIILLEKGAISSDFVKKIICQITRYDPTDLLVYLCFIIGAYFKLIK